MTTRYVYTSPIGGRSQELGLPQLLHPEFTDLGEASALTGNLMAILVDKGYLALYEALQIAGVDPATVKVKQSAPPAREARERECGWCDGRKTKQAPSTDFTIPCPYCKGTGKEVLRAQPQAREDAQPHVHLTYAANSKQHKTDIGWLIEKLQADRRDYLAHDARALRMSRLISFLTEELGR